MERRPLIGSSNGKTYSSDSEESLERNITLSEKEIDAIVTTTSNQHFTKNLALAIAACVCGSSFMLGYNTGVVNTPATVIKDFYNTSYHKRYGDNESADGNTTSSGYLTNTELSILWAATVSIFPLGGMIGGLSAGYWSNKYGRKGALLRNNLLHLIAAALMFSFHYIYSYEMMIAGRFLVGICAGINSGATPLYLSEIAPTSLRGFAGVFNQLAITAGVLVSQILGLDVVLGTNELWPYVLGATVIPIVVMLCLLPWCPETPRFLMLVTKNEDEAEKALIWLRASDDVGEELEEMRSEAEKQKRMPKFAFMDLFHDKYLREPLLISIVLQMTQQFSGINAVIYYSTEIFKTADLSARNAEYATLATGGVNVAMTLISAFIMDKAGRRSLLLIGVGGLFIFSSILALSLILIKEENWTWMSYLAIVAVICYIISFATGPGSIPWFMVAEIFSQGPRSAAVSVSTMVNWFSNFTVGLVFPLLNELLIHQYSFLPFVVLLVFFWIFIYRRVPETKGKTIEEISLLFRGPNLEHERIIQKDSNITNYTRLQNGDSADDSLTTSKGVLRTYSNPDPHGIIELIINHVVAAPIDKLITNAAVETTSFDIVANVSTKTLRLELDILINLDDYVETQRELTLEGRIRKKRKATRNKRKRWPNREVPYIVTNDFSSGDRVQIKAAVNEWSKYTCLNIREATYRDANKVRFQNGNGCSSYIGMVKGEQELNLGKNCRVKRVIVHELGHAIGFQHEQSRPDRDAFVEIVKENVPSALAYNFDRLPESKIEHFNVDYDYRSIMHYSSKAFSTNGMITVRTKDPQYQNVIGNALGLSFRDIKLANRMYSCNENCSAVKCPGQGFQAQDCQCYCPSDDTANPLRVCDESDVVTDKPTVTSTHRTTPATETPVSESCQNGHNYCDFWSKRGHCDSSPGFMNLYCKKACGRCTAETDVCEDVGQHCSFWKDQGYCSMNTMPYMQRNCRKTCEFCKSDEGNGEGIAEPSNSASDNTAKAVFIVMLSVVKLFLTGIF
ncbi:uncharacterized protein LOC125664327 [Ostrea edulis]|uniref:uncharacterized protein LOC125664327 n=1 Tax=Ostrea edulis TaxID=37623 RepID=UPI0024AF460E|nr:uncharacterized protein LOC125664327 [Ostrea edulis]